MRLLQKQYDNTTLTEEEWVLITTCKQLVWSTRIVRNMPIWILNNRIPGRLLQSVLYCRILSSAYRETSETVSSGNWPLFGNFKSSDSSIYQWSLPLVSRFIIGKLTAFWKLQEFRFSNLPVVSSTTTVVFSSLIKSKVGNILPKGEILRITLDIDVVPIACRSHHHTDILISSSSSSFFWHSKTD